MRSLPTSRIQTISGTFAANSPNRPSLPELRSRAHVFAMLPCYGEARRPAVGKAGIGLWGNLDSGPRREQARHESRFPGDDFAFSDTRARGRTGRAGAAQA